MALTPPESSRLSELPIVLLPDADTDIMGPDPAPGSEPEPDVGTRPGPEEPPPPPAPQHPIPSMQQAFAESLAEATQSHAAAKPKLRTGDAKARREELLDGERLDPHPTALWRRRPGQKTHELCRLLAQISFGVYLLLNGMANSQILVVSILQGHINEVDEFLETTLEDMDLATRDMEGRIKHLKLPMDNIDVFERMLEDRNFRLQILDGNQKIEHILARTEVALKQTMNDISEGLTATREFTIYLAEQQHGAWRRERPDVIDIFDAMKGNTDGWFNAFMDLQAKGSSLNALMVRLADIVSEMERRAGEVSRKTQSSVQPHTSPSHSPQPSDASSVTTPPASPPRKIPSSPPRLSLRLSTLNTVDLSIDSDPRPVAAQDAAAEQRSGDEATPRSPLMVTSRSPPPPESPPESPFSSEQPPQSPPARNPRRLSKRPSALLDLPKLETPQERDEEEDEEGTLYILQPRTYTPQLPSPQPSPRIVDERPQPQIDAPKSSVGSSASSIESAAQLTIEHAKPRVEQVFSKQQAHRPKVVEIGAKTNAKATPRLSQPPNFEPTSGPDPAQAPELVVPQDPEVAGRQRSSLRQRISLKTTPPESIQVLPHNAVDSQQPLHAVPRAYQAPDSAYGSDVERPPENSMASMNSSLPDFSPPFVHPGMIPSPHSEKQFFRPVQASPYSPLQQRPHTSGTVGPHHFPPPPRNIPSAMGRSMMSSGASMTNQTVGGKSVKKKRSAFGWLKKAFSLDEEERAAFERRKTEQQVNPYYEARSQQFLDGKRIRPRPAY
ncbi:5d9484b2-54c6-4c12-af6a-be98e3c94133 [Thermothielavioides terrestris]|uniref:Uncharacterized protein n=2 Tax=Thermothielavioides terrestris TaxID=2587410 RepID=G2R3E6_THETT|nr:uncharacterized protein THITE_2113622 [Thermothielavioides terrestris NRRL 8126]AEO65957.1 hypothetical protein THITE_2113622 [Thermothielavioides terrestris NRRL 8126]SPQ18779.1 5d9484b2-54c6-4c12-af6a-be98e3c94133 [Thermothielavioides terrestris]